MRRSVKMSKNWPAQLEQMMRAAGLNPELIKTLPPVEQLQAISGVMQEDVDRQVESARDQPGFESFMPETSHGWDPQSLGFRQHDFEALTATMSRADAMYLVQNRLGMSAKGARDALYGMSRPMSERSPYHELTDFYHPPSRGAQHFYRPEPERSPYAKGQPQRGWDWLTEGAGVQYRKIGDNTVMAEIVGAGAQSHFKRIERVPGGYRVDNRLIQAQQLGAGRGTVFSPEDTVVRALRAATGAAEREIAPEDIKRSAQSEFYREISGYPGMPENYEDMWSPQFQARMNLGIQMRTRAGEFRDPGMWPTYRGPEGYGRLLSRGKESRSFDQQKYGRWMAWSQRAAGVSPEIFASGTPGDETYLAGFSASKAAKRMQISSQELMFMEGRKIHESPFAYRPLDVPGSKDQWTPPRERGQLVRAAVLMTGLLPEGQAIVSPNMPMSQRRINIEHRTPVEHDLPFKGLQKGRPTPVAQQVWEGEGRTSAGWQGRTRKKQPWAQTGRYGTMTLGTTMTGQGITTSISDWRTAVLERQKLTIEPPKEGAVAGEAPESGEWVLRSQILQQMQTGGKTSYKGLGMKAYETVGDLPGRWGVEAIYPTWKNVVGAAHGLVFTAQAEFEEGKHDPSKKYGWEQMRGDLGWTPEKGIDWSRANADKILTAAQKYAGERTEMRRVPFEVHRDLLPAYQMQEKGGTLATTKGFVGSLVPGTASLSKASGVWSMEMEKPMYVGNLIRQARPEYQGREPFVSMEETQQIYSNLSPAFAKQLRSESAERVAPYEHLHQVWESQQKRGRALFSKRPETLAAGTQETEQTWLRVLAGERKLEASAKYAGKSPAMMSQTVIEDIDWLNVVAGEVGSKTIELPTSKGKRILPSPDAVLKFAAMNEYGEQVAPLLHHYAGAIGSAMAMSGAYGEQVPGREGEMDEWASDKIWGKFSGKWEKLMGSSKFQRTLGGAYPKHAFEGVMGSHQALPSRAAVYGREALAEMAGISPKRFPQNQRRIDEFSAYVEEQHARRNPLLSVIARRPISDPKAQWGYGVSEVWTERLARERGVDVKGLGRSAIISPQLAGVGRGDFDADRYISLLLHEGKVGYEKGTRERTHQVLDKSGKQIDTITEGEPGEWSVKTPEWAKRQAAIPLLGKKGLLGQRLATLGGLPKSAAARIPFMESLFANEMGKWTEEQKETKWLNATIRGDWKGMTQEFSGKDMEASYINEMVNKLTGMTAPYNIGRALGIVGADPDATAAFTAVGYQHGLDKLLQIEGYGGEGVKDAPHVEGLKTLMEMWTSYTPGGRAPGQSKKGSGFFRKLGEFGPQWRGGKWQRGAKWETMQPSPLDFTQTVVDAVIKMTTADQYAKDHPDQGLPSHGAGLTAETAGKLLFGGRASEKTASAILAGNVEGTIASVGGVWEGLSQPGILRAIAARRVGSAQLGKTGEQNRQDWSPAGWEGWAGGGGKWKELRDQGKQIQEVTQWVSGGTAGIKPSRLYDVLWQQPFQGEAGEWMAQNMLERLGAPLQDPMEVLGIHTGGGGAFPNVGFRGTGAFGVGTKYEESERKMDLLLSKTEATARATGEGETTVKFAHAGEGTLTQEETAWLAEKAASPQRGQLPPEEGRIAQGIYRTLYEAKFGAKGGVKASSPGTADPGTPGTRTTTPLPQPTQQQAAGAPEMTDAELASVRRMVQYMGTESGRADYDAGYRDAGAASRATAKGMFTAALHGMRGTEPGFAGEGGVEAIYGFGKGQKQPQLATAMSRVRRLHPTMGELSPSQMDRMMGDIAKVESYAETRFPQEDEAKRILGGTGFTGIKGEMITRLGEEGMVSLLERPDMDLVQSLMTGTTSPEIEDAYAQLVKQSPKVADQIRRTIGTTTKPTSEMSMSQLRTSARLMSTTQRVMSKAGYAEEGERAGERAMEYDKLLGTRTKGLEAARGVGQAALTRFEGMAGVGEDIGEAKSVLRGLTKALEPLSEPKFKGEATNLRTAVTDAHTTLKGNIEAFDKLSLSVLEGGTGFRTAVSKIPTRPAARGEEQKLLVSEAQEITKGMRAAGMEVPNWLGGAVGRFAQGTRAQARANLEELARTSLRGEEVAEPGAGGAGVGVKAPRAAPAPAAGGGGIFAAGGMLGGLFGSTMGGGTAPDGGPQGRGVMGASGQLFRQFFSGWELMRLQRMWNLTGGPVFEQWIPQAAQAGGQEWEMARMLGGGAAIPPAGVAGGLMQHQAALELSRIEAGKTGYQAYGGARGALGWYDQARAMLGPAVGAGAIVGNVVGVGAYGFGAGGGAAAGGTGLAAAMGAVGLPVGFAVGAGVAAYGVSRWAAAAVGDPDSARRLAEQRAAGGIEWEAIRYKAGLGIDAEQARLRAAQLGVPLEETRVPAYGFWGPEVTQGVTAADEQAIVEAEIQLRQESQGMTFQQMDIATRASLVGQSIGKLQEQGGAFSYRTKEQILGIISENAPYLDIMGMTQAEFEAGGGPPLLQEWVNRGVGPAVYRPVSEALGMGRGFDIGIERRLHMLPQAEQERRMSATMQRAGMVTFGISPEQIRERTMPQGLQVTGARRGRRGILDSTTFAAGPPEWTKLEGEELRSWQMAESVAGQAATMFGKPTTWALGYQEAFTQMTPEYLQQRQMALPAAAQTYGQTGRMRWGRYTGALVGGASLAAIQQAGQIESGQGRLSGALGMIGGGFGLEQPLSNALLDTAIKPMEYGQLAGLAQFGQGQMGYSMMAGQFGIGSGLGRMYARLGAAGMGPGVPWGEALISEEGFQIGQLQRRQAGRGMQLAQRGQQRWQFGQQQLGLDYAREEQGAAYAYQMGQRGPDSYGLLGQIDLSRSIRTITIAMRGVADDMRDAGRGYTEQGWGFARRGMEMNLEQQMERMGLQRKGYLADVEYQRETRGFQRGQQLTQQVWRQEDVAWGRGMAGFQFEFQMDEMDRAMRLAGGREREQLWRRREYSEEMYARQETRRGTEEGRLQQQIEWENQLFGMQSTHFEMTVQRQNQQYEMNLRHVTERYSLEEDRLTAQIIHTEEMWGYQDKNLELQRQGEDERYEFQQRSMEAQKTYAELAYGFQIRRQEMQQDALDNAVQFYEKTVIPYQEEMYTLQVRVDQAHADYVAWQIKQYEPGSELYKAVMAFIGDIMGSLEDWLPTFISDTSRAGMGDFPHRATQEASSDTSEMANIVPMVVQALAGTGMNLKLDDGQTFKGHIEVVGDERIQTNAEMEGWGGVWQ
jgi:hypothetical protein